MKVVESKEIYKCKLFTVTEERATDASGFEIHRNIVRHEGSAVILVMDERSRILLVRQFRLPANRSLWEIPAGRLDPGETPLKAAKRELAEETGYRAKEWKKLVSFYPSPGYVGEKMTLFLATGLNEGEATPMEDERIETRWFKPREVDKMIGEGEIVDAKTIIAFLMWRRRG